MFKAKKRNFIISILLSLMLVITAWVVPVSADSTTDLSLNSYTMTISGIHAKNNQMMNGSKVISFIVG